MSTDSNRNSEVKGLTYAPQMWRDKGCVYDFVQWKYVNVELKNAEGKVIYSQRQVEVPAQWSERAVRILAQKYFYGQEGTDTRENSARTVIERVVSTIGRWAVEQGYFQDTVHLTYFLKDLRYILVNQIAAFNSPVWFNLGVPSVKQQVSACFIQSVEDSLKSLADLQRREILVFRGGSGSGTNFSHVRSSRDTLSGGGVPSGPLSFMKGLDSWGGVIKSGGTTRRAAKMCILNYDHPDIVEFIQSKVKEEEKAKALVREGYSTSFDDNEGAYASVSFQNANNSVRVPDHFMKKVEKALAGQDVDSTYKVLDRKGHAVETLRVLDVWNSICEATWKIGDPGLQFHTTQNAWSTVDEEIEASNPCGEFTFLNETSCNLASINLMQCLRLIQNKDTSTYVFDYPKFDQIVRTMIIAQDILVSKADYPTEEIANKTKQYRPLGLGYTNLGAVLLSMGIGYDSVAGTRLAQNITSRMTAIAYDQSASIAKELGPFPAYVANSGQVVSTIRKHLRAATEFDADSIDWENTLEAVSAYGLRNAQVTLLAPTGTISFLMDCETTGCEPELSLHNVKRYVGGGKTVQKSAAVSKAFESLGYTGALYRTLLEYVGKNGYVPLSKIDKKNHAVFDSAMEDSNGRSLSIDAHINMAAAIQPFLSGAISKTMNLPNSATMTDISNAYLRSWQKGLKSVTLYRDGCKLSQPVTSVSSKETGKEEKERERDIGSMTVRRRLSDHQMNMHRIRIAFANMKGYILVTPFEDTGMPGEIFIKLAKEGSTISGLVDGWARAISYSLQYGVPLATLVEKFSNTKFEPAGWSKDPDIHFATSIYDAVMRKLAAVFLKPEKKGSEGGGEEEEIAKKLASPEPPVVSSTNMPTADAPVCSECGSLMVRTGATCHSCPVCGTSSGCG